MVTRAGVCRPYGDPIDRARRPSTDARPLNRIWRSDTIGESNGGLGACQVESTAVQCEPWVNRRPVLPFAPCGTDRPWTGRAADIKHDDAMPATPRRIPLNPCDYLFYAHHRGQERRIGGGNVAFMTLDFMGHVSLRRMRDALVAALQRHPAAAGVLRVSLFRGRPYWHYPVKSDDIERAAARAHVFYDLRHDSQASASLDRLCSEHFTPHWNFALGPPIRLEHYALPENQTRLCLRWPHGFMDAEGAQLLLSEIGRFGDADAAQATVPPDHAALDPLKGFGVLERIKLMRSAPKRPHRLSGRNEVLLAAPAKKPVRQYRFLHRVWSPEDNVLLTELARQRTPPGPGLRARYLAASVIRALDRLYTAQKIATDVYRIPIPVRAADGAATSPPPRPIPGNYLAAPAVSIPRTCVSDWALLGETIAAQLESYVKSKSNLADWAKLWLASQLRPRQFEFALSLPLGLPDFSTGFSYYGEVDPPLRTFLGIPVSNLWGCAPMAIPPGLNPAFSRYQDRLNFSLAWSEPHLDATWPETLTQYIEFEALGRTS